MSTTIDVSSPQWQRLYRMWLGQGKPGIIVIGDNNYTAATPNGEDSPIFILQTKEDLYGSISIEPGKDSPLRK